MNVEIENLIKRLKAMLLLGVSAIIVEETVFDIFIPSPEHFRLLLLVVFATAMVVFEIRTIRENVEHLSSPAGEVFQRHMRIATIGLFLILATTYLYPNGVILSSYKIKNTIAYVCLALGAVYQYVAIKKFEKEVAQETAVVDVDLSDEEGDDDEEGYEEDDTEQ